MLKKAISKIPIVFFVVIVLVLGFNIYQLNSWNTELYDVPPEYTYGPADADLKVVEFIKYTCPHCRNIHPIIMEAVKQDGRVLYIPRPLPSEVKDAHLVYAAGKQGLFKLAHPVLLQDERILDKDGLMTIAQDTFGANIEQLKKDMESEEVQNLVNQNVKVFLGIGENSVPIFILGKNIKYIPQGKMPTVEDFLTLFAEARK